MKRICAAALALLLMAAGCSAAPAAPSAVMPNFSERAYVAYSGAEDLLPGLPPEGMEFVARKGYTAMFFNPQTAEFVLEDMRSGERYYSMSPDPAGTLQERSQLILADLDLDGGNIRTKYSANAVVSTRKADNGFQVWYAFQDEQYAVPVEYLLMEDGLRVRVRCDQIVEQGAVNRVASITLLPFLYAQKGYPDGFILVPDGSGAILRLNEDKSFYSSYEGALYGDAYLTVPDYRSEVTENCLLPFVGMQGETGGFFAMAEAGSSAGNVIASVEGQDASASRVCFRFDLRKQQEAHIGNPDSTTAKTVLVNEEGPITLQDVSVRYFLLDSTPETGLKEMAEIARNIVDDQSGGVTAAPDNEVYLTTLGGYTAENPILGFRAKTTKTITSFEMAAEMISRLQEKGVDRAALIYTGYNREELRGGIIGVPKPDGAVGSVSELTALAELLGPQRLLMEVNPVEFRKDGQGFSKNRSAIRDLNLKTVEVYRYKRNTTHADRENATYLLKIPYASDVLLQAEEWMKEKLPSAGIMVSGFSSKLYGDYSENGYNREQALQKVRDTLREMSGRNPLCTEAANYDAALYSSVIVDVPNSSSGYDAFDESVPFYQMVFSGSRQLVSRPINSLSGDVEGAFLDCIRFGMTPHFELIAEKETMLGQYGMDSFYAAAFADWGEKIAVYSRRYEAVQEAVQGRVLEDYRVLDTGLYQLTYSGGVQLLVNQTAQDMVISGQTVDAGSFTILS